MEENPGLFQPDVEYGGWWGGGPNVSQMDGPGSSLSSLWSVLSWVELQEQELTFFGPNLLMESVKLAWSIKHMNGNHSMLKQTKMNFNLLNKNIIFNTLQQFYIIVTDASQIWMNMPLTPSQWVINQWAACKCDLEHHSQVLVSVLLWTVHSASLLQFVVSAGSCVVNTSSVSDWPVCFLMPFTLDEWYTAFFSWTYLLCSLCFIAEPKPLLRWIILVI